MILQQKQVKRDYFIVIKTINKPGQSMTIPGQSFNVKLAMEQYKKGTIVERVKGFYEKQGFETPDFNSMSHIEKLQALADYRKLAKEAASRLDSSHLKANKQYQKDVLEKETAAKAKQSTDDTGKPKSV